MVYLPVGTFVLPELIVALVAIPVGMFVVLPVVVLRVAQQVVLRVDQQVDPPVDLRGYL